MFGYSYLVTDLKKDNEVTDTGEKDSGFWNVCGRRREGPRDRCGGTDWQN